MYISAPQFVEILRYLFGRMQNDPQMVGHWDTFWHRVDHTTHSWHPAWWWAIITSKCSIIKESLPVPCWGSVKCHAVHLLVQLYTSSRGITAAGPVPNVFETETLKATVVMNGRFYLRKIIWIRKPLGTGCVLPRTLWKSEWRGNRENDGSPPDVGGPFFVDKPKAQQMHRCPSPVSRNGSNNSINSWST